MRFLSVQLGINWRIYYHNHSYLTLRVSHSFETQHMKEKQPSATMQQHRPFDITALPTELLIKVVFSLDGYSINNLIEAFPSLSKYFLLMTKEDNSVFTAPNLRHYDAEKDKALNLKQYIKLYVGTPYMSTASCDRLSFVHISTPPNRYAKEEYAVHMMQKETPATIDCSYSPPGTVVDASGLYGNELQLDPDMESLVLKNVHHLSGVSHSTVKTLTVVFTSGPDEAPPSLKHLRLPQLKKLILVYNDQFPELEDIDLGERRRADIDPTTTMLSLIHMPSIRVSLDGPLPQFDQILTPWTRYMLGDLRALGDEPSTNRVWPLTHYFSRIQVIGRPGFLGKLVCSRRCLPKLRPKTSFHDGYSRLWSIDWKQTSQSVCAQATIYVGEAFGSVGWGSLGGVSYECS